MEAWRLVRKGEFKQTIQKRKKVERWTEGNRSRKGLERGKQSREGAIRKDRGTKKGWEA